MPKHFNATPSRFGSQAGHLGLSVLVPRFAVIRLLALGLVVAGPLLLGIGCGKSSGIQSFSVEKTQPPRIVVATVEVGGVIWFFKLNGAADLVELHLDEFRDFLASVKFERGEPKWSLPEGWEKVKRGTEGEFSRFGSMAIPTDKEILDVSVSSLSAPQTGIDDQYLIINLNRWRDQVKLGPIKEREDDWKNDLTAISIDGVPALLADITGSINREFTPPQAAQAVRPSTDPVAEPGFTYDVPKHWMSGPSSSFVAASWTVGEGEEMVKIPLSFAGGDLAANVNRWRGQVGLADLPASDLGATEILVDGQTGQLFDLVGESQRIMGVIVPQTRLSLFVKMTGPVELVEQERPNFIAFAHSLKVN